MPKIFLEFFVNPKLSPPPFINKFNETHLKFKSFYVLRAGNDHQ
jgi:hypothetical protein